MILSTGGGGGACSRGREGCLLPGGCLVWGVGVPGLGGVHGGDHPGTDTAAGATHPTGMHSCLILGILHELLKQNPKHIVMVDIDEIVVSAATKYLRGICYDSMDQLVGDNYEVFDTGNI